MSQLDKSQLDASFFLFRQELVRDGVEVGLKLRQRLTLWGNVDIMKAIVVDPKPEMANSKSEARALLKCWSNLRPCY